MKMTEDKNKNETKKIEWGRNDRKRKTKTIWPEEMKGNVEFNINN